MTSHPCNTREAMDMKDDGRAPVTICPTFPYIGPQMNGLSRPRAQAIRMTHPPEPELKHAA
jgi:hypothetical protein